MIISSCKSTELFILEDNGSDDDVASDISSPYVSPSKEKKISNMEVYN